MNTNRIFFTAILLVFICSLVHSQKNSFLDLDIMQLPGDRLLDSDYPLIINQKSKGKKITKRNDNLMFLDSIVHPSQNVVFIEYDEQDRATLVEVKSNKTLLSKTIYKFRENSDLIDYTDDELYNNDGSLIVLARSDYAYNEDDLLISIDIVEDITGYENVIRGSRFFYDSDENLITTEGYEIDENGIEFVNGMNEYLYDQSSRLDSITRTRFNMDPNATSGSPSSKYTYDSLGNLILITDSSDTADISGREEFTHDSKGNVITYFRVTTFFDVEFRNFVENEFNNDLDKEDLTSIFSGINETSIPSVNVPHQSQILRSLSSEDGTNPAISTYHWSTRGINTSVALADDIGLIKPYPNPVTSNLQFQNLDIVENLQLTVYDLLGRRILDDEMMHIDQQFDVSSLIDGSYFFTIRNDSEVLYSGRFVKN